MKNEKLTLKLNEVGINDIALVGGKNASLGEMIGNLSGLGINIPLGYALTVAAYKEFIRFNNLERTIQEKINRVDAANLESLQQTGIEVRELIRNGRFSSHLQAEIEEAYRQLSKKYSTEDVDVAVRSSATAEDLPDASFAGQQETFLNVSGIDQLLDAIRNCFASLFTDRAISYRQSFGYNHFDVHLSVCVQKMVRSDEASSGVAFSIDTESGFKDAIVINGSVGLGEMVVQGAVCPDEFLVFKSGLKRGFPAIIEKKLGLKDKKMVYSTVDDERVKIIDTNEEEEFSFCISDEQVLKLAKWVILIEEYYSRVKGHYCPMDIEWATDGLTGELFIVQARPETIQSRKDRNTFTTYILDKQEGAEQIIIKGIAVGDKIGQGQVKIIRAYDKADLQKLDFKEGDVLVTDMTDPDWEPLMKIASAIITNKGGRTCHAAIVARELGIPAVVACQNATDLLKEGDLVTVSCAEGDTGIVYRGSLNYRIEVINLADLPQTETPVLLNVASPEKAFHFAHLPSSGVGLAREEFIINNYIKVHPLALLNHQKLNDKSLSAEIVKLTRGFHSCEDFFVKKLSYGIAKIAAAFYPNQVIVRFSDFKSNEYFNMLGGKYFEPQEENPMIGWRGASRYYSDQYKHAFGLECKAIKAVREELGLGNVKVMIPFCRTIDELKQVYSVMEEYGLKRGENGLQVYLMAEIPANVIMAESFAEMVDGFSIGSNDLTQLVLGLDRDSSLVAGLFDERNIAVKTMIKMLIHTAKRKGVKVGICGQGPSDFPDFAQFLVEEGIDTISVTPDSCIKTLKAIAEIERKEVKAA